MLLFICIVPLCVMCALSQLFRFIHFLHAGIINNFLMSLMNDSYCKFNTQQFTFLLSVFDPMDMKELKWDISLPWVSYIIVAKNNS